MRFRNAVPALAIGGVLALGGCGGGDDATTSAEPAKAMKHDEAMKGDDGMKHEDAMKNDGDAMKHGDAMKDDSKEP